VPKFEQKFRCLPNRNTFDFRDYHSSGFLSNGPNGVVQVGAVTHYKTVLCLAGALVDRVAADFGGTPAIEQAGPRVAAILSVVETADGLKFRSASISAPSCQAWQTFPLVGSQSSRRLVGWLAPRPQTLSQSPTGADRVLARRARSFASKRPSPRLRSRLHRKNSAARPERIPPTRDETRNEMKTCYLIQWAPRRAGRSNLGRRSR
jgi:hypothetical protein